MTARRIALGAKKADAGSPGGTSIAAKNQKTLIPLDFSNLELHNKLLARRHPTMG
jgi:hypothetical protein